ncbi:hypothetical protein [Mesorhizobium sp. KR1-2]|uniref:phage major capsid protein n=1 Tax=Mesorhizobium sp. KR1-2 TaxID=3156609 RepID=UPI0032B52BA2
MTKGSFRVLVIKAGLSLNRTFYSDAVLRRHAPMFEGARVFAKSDREHIALEGKDVRNLIGCIVSPEFVPGSSPDSGEIVGTLKLIDPSSIIGHQLAKAVENDMLGLFGLSIAAEGESIRRADGTREAVSFAKIHSVDLIVEPGAGGRIVSFVEAAGSLSQGTLMTREDIIALIQATRPEALAEKNVDEMTDAELQDLLRALLKADNPETADTMTEAVQRKVRLGDRIAACGLPEVAKQKLRAEVTANVIMTEAHLTRRISQEGRYLTAAGVGGGHVTGLGGVQMGDGPREKATQMLDAFFDPKDRSVRSFRECYVTLTGDTGFTGRPPRNQRMTEALGTDTLAIVLGDAITRRMLVEYANDDILDVWRDLVNIVPVNDFRTQERVRWGGYGDLPTVAERAPYTQLTSPTDEKATYAVSKRGGTETVSLEAITNDDVGLIQRIPQNLARAAKRTLSKFVFDIPRLNHAIYDTKPLFHADHKNLMAAELSAEAVGQARLLIREQREKDSGEKIGLTARYLWVPDTLEEVAYNLFVRGVNNDPTFTQSLAWKVRPVWCWTDDNDWCVSTDPRDLPAIELGFLQGQEEPELFVQDSPTVGSFFTNDIITYKVRHIYGATVTDFRGIVKSVVPAPEAAG